MPETNVTVPPSAPDLDLGSGLVIRSLPVAALREQDKNARYMTKEMMERLTATVRRDQRLESLPFCAETKRGVEIVSGHHRVRAATAAGQTNVWCIVDTTGLTPDQIKAKQLAHNSIAGIDDEAVLAQIYGEIADSESRLEAFLDRKFDIPPLPESITGAGDFDPVQTVQRHRAPHQRGVRHSATGDGADKDVGDRAGLSR
jgi:hypothetical protein